MEDDLHSWWSVSHIFLSALARNQGGKLTFAPTESNFLIWRADRDGLTPLMVSLKRRLIGRKGISVLQLRIGSAQSERK